ncbi:MAG: FapA family protein [Proteobacteria bacterium]|nr:FapA family protein [Pseudomonadota bacterium]MBU1417724.1 FapA family protein [Pseudomonadota bacterium]MBU1454936.1 FapA family protein [Pseudomonadota bacterium]
MTDSRPIFNPQCLFPDILFRTEIITKEEKESPSFETVELVRKNSPLVRLIEAKKEYSPPTPISLLAATHTVLSENKDSLLADVDGYPFLSRQKVADGETLSVSVIPLVSIADDKMEANITLYPSVVGCNELTGEQLFEILKDNQIQFGLDLAQLKGLIQQCNQEQAILSAKTVARGFLPLPGKDSFLRFDIEVGPLPGKILGNGKIDFRERKMFVGVKKGQLIATRIPATAGTPGINVLGKEVPQQKGKDIAVIVSDDAEYDEESGEIRALRSGILSMVNENSIKVCAKQIISGDIDFSTGNIESKDAVEISGSLLPGFEVRTHGDLLIGGSVRSAFIHCRGNLVIKEGIIGDHGEIRVRGDADFNFIEQGRIKSGGRVIIRKQSYYSRIMAGGDIHCQENSQVMSGLLLSGGSISLGSVGSANAPPAIIAAGIEPERYLYSMEIRSRLRKAEEELHLWLQRNGQQAKASRRQSLEESIHSLKQDLHDISLIPGLSSATPEETLYYLRGISIIVHETIFSGTKLQIGNISRTTERDFKGLRFLPDTTGSTITAIDL